MNATLATEVGLGIALFTAIIIMLVVVILAVITLFYFIAALRGYQSSMQEAERLFAMARNFGRS